MARAPAWWSRSSADATALRLRRIDACPVSALSSSGWLTRGPSERRGAVGGPSVASIRHIVACGYVHSGDALERPKWWSPEFLASLLHSKRFQLDDDEWAIVPAFRETLMPNVLGNLVATHAVACLLSKYRCGNGPVAQLVEALWEGLQQHPVVVARRRGTSSPVYSPTTPRVRASPPAEPTALPAMTMILQTQLLMCCSDDSDVPLMESILSDVVEPMPASLVVSCLAMGSVVACKKILTAQQQRIHGHVRGLQKQDADFLRRKSPWLIDSLLFTDPADFGAYWKALLNNDCFFTRGSVGMHEILVSLIKAVPCGASSSGSNSSGGSVKWSVVHGGHGSGSHQAEDATTTVTVKHSSALLTLDWAALLNQTSRVYGKTHLGRELLEIHWLLVDKFFGVEQRMPIMYLQRVIGVMVDSFHSNSVVDPDHLWSSDMQQQQQQPLDDAFDPWSALRPFVHWAVRLHPSQADFRRHVLHLARKAAVGFAPPAAAWDEDVTCMRLLELYECFFDGADMPRRGSDDHPSRVELQSGSADGLLDKDAFRQLVRRCCDTIARPDWPQHAARNVELVSRLLRYWEMDVGIKHLWIVDGVAALVNAVAAAFETRIHERDNRSTTTQQGGEEQKRKSVGHGGGNVVDGEEAKWIGMYSRMVRDVMQNVEGRIMPQRGIERLMLAQNPVIQRALDRLQSFIMVPCDAIDAHQPPEFWWSCGCGARNPAAAPHCFVCLRRGRIQWTCAGCQKEHTQSGAGGRWKGAECANCHLPHPRVEAAELHGCSICRRCSHVISSDDGVCRACQQLPPERSEGTLSAAGDDRTASVAVGSSECACTLCKTVYPGRSPSCPQCFEPNPAVDPKLWLCETCNNFSFTTWSQCQRCKDPPSVKKSDSPIMHFTPWICGCGRRNHPCRLACVVCSKQKYALPRGNHPSSSKPTPFTCRHCGQGSRCTRRRAFPLTSAATAATGESAVSTCEETGASSRIFLVTECEHCGYPHPRDEIVLSAKRFVKRLCLSCGEQYAARNGNGSTPQVCHRCMSLQKTNTNHYFSCESPQCRTSHQQGQPGVVCSECGTLRPDVDPDAVFVWKCMQPLPGASHKAGDNGGIDEDVLDVRRGCDSGDDDTVELCLGWNTSWDASCSHCNAPRPHVPSSEIRARYAPWTCGGCHEVHSATTVLICPTCDEGFQTVTPCPTCGVSHVALRCPTVEDLQEAECALQLMEREAS